MYIMYVDESGDSGQLPNSPSEFFILSGLVIPQCRWLETLDKLIKFRRQLKSKHGFKMNDEFHASKVFFNGQSLEERKTPFYRMGLIIEYAKMLASMEHIKLINVVVDKTTKNENILHIAWDRLIQRFDNTLKSGNFPNSVKKSANSIYSKLQNEQYSELQSEQYHDYGIAIHDQSENTVIKKIIRKNRRFNNIPSKYNPGETITNPLKHILEDPIPRESLDSYFIQSVDVCSFLLKQYIDPSSKAKKHCLHTKFDILSPICLTEASPNNKYGIVWIK